MCTALINNDLLHPVLCLCFCEHTISLRTLSPLSGQDHLAYFKLSGILKLNSEDVWWCAAVLQCELVNNLYLKEQIEIFHHP